MAQHRPLALVCPPPLGGTPFDRELVQSALNLQLITGNLGKAGGGLAFLAPKANTLGAWELGAVNPGNPELFALLETGKLKGLFLIAEDPAGRSHCSPDQAAALKASGIFLVVQDLFLSAAAEQADLILPALPYSEKMGTFTQCGKTGATPEALHPTRTRDPVDRRSFAPIGRQVGDLLAPADPRTNPGGNRPELPGLVRINRAPLGTRRSAMALPAAGPPRDPHFIYGRISDRNGPPGVHLKGAPLKIRAGNRLHRRF